MTVWKTPRHCPPLKTTSRLPTHASRGGNPHQHDFHQAMMHAMGHGHMNDPLMRSLRQHRLCPSRTASWRHNIKRQTLGHFRAFVKQGNSRATILRGEDLFFLAHCRTLCPEATTAEVNAFLHNCNGQERFFCPSSITRAEQRVGLARKRGSTTACQANHPRVV